MKLTKDDQDRLNAALMRSSTLVGEIPMTSDTPADMPTREEVAVSGDGTERPFDQQLQGYASFCESLGRNLEDIDKADLDMLAAKFRDAAFVVDQLTKLRDGKIASGWQLVPADRFAKVTAERDELRRAIMGAEPMPELRHGNFMEMARTLHAAREGAVARAEAAEAALATARVQYLREGMEKAAGIAKHYASIVKSHGSMPVDPYEAAECAANEIATSICAARPAIRTALPEVK